MIKVARRLLLAIAVLVPAMAHAAERFITLGSTTSTEQSGLFEFLLPRFEQKTGIEIRVVAVGTGQALEMARKGDADALLVHDRAGENKLVAEGWGIDRHNVMYNDFVIIGPKGDPAAVAGMTDASAALAMIAHARSPFASRGDDSGTHRAELRLWQAAGVDVKTSGADWYRETGSGMGPTLNTAAGMPAYVLSDRATWANFKNRQDLVVLVQGDKRLFNPYGSILVNPEKHPSTKIDDARTWQQWLTSGEGQKAIAAYRIDGQQLFFPNATGPES
jgi:tungstate transport system substrate-binding protein